MSTENGNSNGLYPDIHESKSQSSSSKTFMDHGPEDLALVVKAADFAARRHRFQKRKDHTSTPYINHPIEKSSKCTLPLLQSMAVYGQVVSRTFSNTTYLCERS
ncbi:hypothetical protein GCK32_005047 [Trichostrongylus colubriformis]|uniref:Uncharacterized protein n=1 Tax=Trichostrongylus colubriformis TaxID=6319 RepID=A0AAN8IGR6_TRICO